MMSDDDDDNVGCMFDCASNLEGEIGSHLAPKKKKKKKGGGGQHFNKFSIIQFITTSIDLYCKSFME